MDRKRISHPLSEEPTMSDKTIMLDIEDLISLTFGPLETNVVNFAMMQTVLNILVRHMRFLEDDIEIKFNDDQEKIMTLMHDLQEGSIQGSSEFEKEIFVSKDVLEGYITPDETGQHVESKPKKSERERAGTLALAKTAKDLGTSEKAEDISEIKSKKTKERARSKTPRTDDDDKDRSIDGQTDEPVKKIKKKEKTMGRDSPSLDRSEYSETKSEKKFEGKQKRKPKVGETVDDIQSLHKSEGVGYEKESASKKERKPQKQPADETDDREDIEKKGKSTRPKSTNKDKVSGDSQTSDRPEDTRSQKGDEGKDTMSSQKRRTPEVSSASGRSDEVGDRQDQKRKDEVSVSGRSADIAVKRDKKSTDDQQPKKEKPAEISVAESPKDVTDGKVKKSKDESQKQSKKGQISADSSIPDKSEDVREKKAKKSGDKFQSRSKQSKTPRDSSVSDDSELSGDEISFKKGDDKTDRSQSKKEKRSEDSAVSGRPQDVKDKSKSKTPPAKKGQMLEDSSVSDISENEIVSKHERSSDKRVPAKKTEYTGNKKEVQSKLSKSIPATPQLSEAERGGTRKEKKSKYDKIEGASIKGKSPTATSSTTGIIVSEAIRKGGKGPKDKILVVEKGPTTRDSHPRIGKINVVPRPPFEALKSDVQKIVDKAGPLPLPTMPLSQQLKEDLASGAATLTGTMQAMQLNTRVKAAENALTRMADILTQLAIEGTLPPDARDLVVQLQEERKELSGIMSKVIPLQKKTSKTSLLPSGPLEIIDDDTVDLSSVKPVVGKPAPPKKPIRPPQRQREDKSTDPTTSLVPPDNPLVTRSNLSSAIENMKNDMLTQMTSMTAQSTRSAEQATNMAKSIVDRIQVAMAVSSRIEDLKKFTTEQSELLSGFDSGLTCHLQEFKNKLKCMRDEFRKGLDLLVMRHNNESTAVSSIREQHDRIELQMDETIHHHSSLVSTYRQMHGELKNLKIWVDLLRDEKADRHEVVNGLSDKVNINQLIGLVHEDEFEACRKDMKKRLLACHDTFTTNTNNWMTSLNEISRASRDKANVLSLHSVKAYATAYLTEITSMLERIEGILGEPELAKLTRLLWGDGTCGACRVPALIEPFERSYGLPPPMPVLPFEEIVEEKESEELLRPPDLRKHICKRWVGGSHTMFKPPPAVERLHPSQLQEVPTTHHPGAGEDGAMYMVEENLEACVECNVVWKDEVKDKPAEVGGGDLAAKQSFAQDIKEADQGDELDVQDIKEADQGDELDVQDIKEADQGDELNNLSLESTDRVLGLVNY